MHFKHPEILYFLFLLVIPILVHLFQLRKFKIEYFTNVKLLAELSVQTRKSSTLKKYLLLATRLLLLSFLIIAFAQPYFDAKDSKNKQNELYILVDNSFSMQAKGQNGELFKRAIQDILEATPANSQLSILTNTEEFWNTSIDLVAKDLQKLSYSAIPFSLEQALTKIKSHPTNPSKDIVVITDGIGINSDALNKLPQNTNLQFIIPKAEKLDNIAIDSVYIAQTLDNFYELGVAISSNTTTDTNASATASIPIALYQKENLVAKTILKRNKAKQTINFTIPKTEFIGHVALNDNSLSFDNTFYFSIPKPNPLRILSIGNATNATFLAKLYPTPEFNYQNVALENLNYSQIANQDAIIVNELDNIPVALHSNLKKFAENGGNVIVIPSAKIAVSNMNSFLANFGKIQVDSWNQQEKKITNINFGNPLFQEVFEKKVTNFQYPYVKGSFTLHSGASPAVSLEDQSEFIATLYKSSGAVFVFSAPINKENSNFQNSPLIVPIFYKMATNNSKNGVSYEKIGKNNPILVTVNVAKEEVISIRNSKEEFIPMQQILEGKVKIFSGDSPRNAGIFEIVQNKKPIESICFNYDRKESNLGAPKEAFLEQIETVDSLDSYLESIAIARTDTFIWKWFLVLTLLFLLLEILIQKFIP